MLEDFKDLSNESLNLLMMTTHITISLHTYPVGLFGLFQTVQA